MIRTTLKRADSGMVESYKRGNHENHRKPEQRLINFDNLQNQTHSEYFEGDLSISILRL